MSVSTQKQVTLPRATVKASTVVRAKSNQNLFKTNLNEFLEIIKCNDKRILKLSREENALEVRRNINSYKIVNTTRTKRKVSEAKFLKRAKKRFKKSVGIGYKPRVLV